MRDDVNLLANLLDAHAKEIRTLGKRVVADVIEIGRHLTEANQLVAHGYWLTWLDGEFAWSDDTARNFMRVYEMSKSRNFRDLSLPISSLYLLAKPSTPEAARDEVIQRAEAGEKVGHARVKEIVAGHKPAPKPNASPPPSPEAVAPPSVSLVIRDDDHEAATARSEARRIEYVGGAPQSDPRTQQDPVFAAYQDWLVRVREIADSPVPKEVVAHLRGKSGDRRKMAVAGVVKELSRLSEKLDWLRAEIADIDRPPPAPRASSDSRLH